MAVHVIETPGIGLQLTNGLGFSLGVFFRPSVFCQLSFLIAKAPSTFASRPAGILPLGLVGQTVFIRLLRMVIIPLVFASIFMSIVKLGDVRKLKRIGSSTVIYYLATTALAVLLGMILVNWIHPGQGIDPEAISRLQMEQVVPDAVAAQGVGERSAFIIILDQLIDMIPKNPIKANMPAIAA